RLLVSADVVNFLLESKPIEAPQRKAEEQIDSAVENKKCFAEGPFHFGRCPLNRCRVGHAPVCGYRLPWPDWADFFRRVVTNSEHEIQFRRLRLGELVPVLASQPCTRQARTFELTKGFRAHCSRRTTSGAVGGELGISFEVQDCLSHDRARGISRTEKQNVIVFSHRYIRMPTSRSTWDRSRLSFRRFRRPFRQLS